MNILLSEDRCCDECYGNGDRIVHDKNYGTANEKREPCGHCRGTGREMSDLGRELFDVMKEHFGLVPKLDR